jgi:hypothetical protein
MLNVYSQQYAGQKTVPSARGGGSRSYWKYAILLTIIIIVIGVFFLYYLGMLFPKETKFDESWCKALLSRHDPVVMKMTFAVNDSGLTVKKFNQTLRFTRDSFAAVAVNMVLRDGRIEECSLESISNKGADLLKPRVYSCANETSYRLSYEKGSDYLYVGKGIGYLLSGKMVRDALASMNLSSNMQGYAYIDYISYRTPDETQNYENDIAEVNSFTSAYCTEE